VKTLSTIRPRNREAGIALLIAIFVLLLVCVVGIAMIVASGTETALTGNYHSATTVYYAALAGLEEGRGRLSPKNPDYINIAVPGFLPAPGTPLALGHVLYIENPLPSETVNPTSSGSASTYQDTEYDTEFGAGALAGASISQTSSVSTVAGIQGPLFKWVRINAITENAIHIDVNHDGTFDPTTPLYYDGSNLNLTSTGHQALEVTSLAAYPNGSQKILQYAVARGVLSLNFPGALTMVGSSGNDVYFTGPGTPGFYVNGNDQYSQGSCTPTAPPRPAIAYVGGDTDNITASPAANYLGAGPSPSVQAGSLPANLSTPSLMETNLVQAIWQNADTILTPSPLPSPWSFYPYTYSSLPTGTMSATNPMTIVVNGDLDLTAWHGTGYGLLLVTGTLTYDPDATWYGIVLVIGQGKFISTKGGTGQFNGEMLIANTRDSSDNILSAFGPAYFSQTGAAPSGYGIYYSNCYVKWAQPPMPYQVLSFHEIPE
jgi:hypothetical protein